MVGNYLLKIGMGLGFSGLIIKYENLKVRVICFIQYAPDAGRQQADAIPGGD